VDNRRFTPNIASESRTLFHLERDEDETGVSGIGYVAEGIIFSNGKVVLSWLTEATSLAVYENMRHLEAIHGHGGKTRIVFDHAERRERRFKTKEPGASHGEPGTKIKVHTPSEPAEDVEETPTRELASEQHE
jgi:hypothetical protein